LVVAVNLGLVIIIVEYSLRAYKSTTYDGILWLRTSSVNSDSHPKYGWFSPQGRAYEKADPCYGTGTVSYNQKGFRAPDFGNRSQWDFVVLVVGDSTMHGYQLPDGTIFSHLLQKRLQAHFEHPYVLPVAVGGYGTVQQFLLMADVIEEMKPNLVIHHWAGNDITNNSFILEKRGQMDNNMRRRPYYENGVIVYRRPFPLHITDWSDNLMVFKIGNLLLGKWLYRGGLVPEELARAEKEAWEVTDLFLGKISQLTAAPKIALLSSDSKKVVDQKVKGLYEKHGYSISIHPFIPKKYRCLPRDNHPTSKGHEMMVESIWPAVINVVTNRAKP